jgi:hypothetical protein
VSNWLRISEVWLNKDEGWVWWRVMSSLISASIVLGGGCVMVAMKLEVRV